MDRADLKDHQWWERYFAVGGEWEKHGGREQTRIFAEAFVAHAGLPRDRAFSLLDAGCALGDALTVFGRAYPEVELHGLDFSAVAVSRATAHLGPRAAITQGDIESIRGHYDVVFCSNTLEHFADYERKARTLGAHCSQLCIMVPYREFREGRPLQPDPTEHHQHTFERDSFDFLLREGRASKIDVEVFACPGAWGWTTGERAVQGVKNLVRVAVGRHWIRPPLQILYKIETRPASAPSAGVRAAQVAS